MQKRKKLHVKKNDLVMVLSGKDKGKRGVVLDVLPKKARAIVEGIHMIKRHMRPSQQAPQGGIIEREGTIHLSNLKVICPKTNRPSRIKRRVITKSVGNRTKKFHQRIAIKSGEIVDRD